MSGAIVRLIGSPSISALPTMLMIRVYYFSINHHKWLHARLPTEANLLFQSLSFFRRQDDDNLNKKCTSNKINTCLFQKDKKMEKKSLKIKGWR